MGLAKVLGEVRNEKVFICPGWICALWPFHGVISASLQSKWKLEFQRTSTILDSKTTDWNLTSKDVACVAQIYDGASALSGVLTGSQELFRQPHPYAHACVCCYAHFLILALVGTCSTFSLYVIFSNML